jgi:hypothetical protein
MNPRTTPRVGATVSGGEEACCYQVRSVGAMRVRSVADPGCLTLIRIRIFPSRTLDLESERSRIRIKEFLKAFKTQKIVTKLSKLCSSQIPIISIPDPDPESKKCTRSRIRSTSRQCELRHAEQRRQRLHLVKLSL